MVDPEWQFDYYSSIVDNKEKSKMAKKNGKEKWYSVKKDLI
jgi:hypothetical protein